MYIEMLFKSTTDNAYGELLFKNEKTGELSNVMCGHGGSMWLCRECKNKALSSQEKGGNKSMPIDYKELWVKAVGSFSKSKRTQWSTDKVVEKMKDMELDEARKPQPDVVGD